MSCDLLL